MAGPMVTWGLLAAWVIHDLEEWATMPGWSERAASRLSGRFPRVPARVWRALRITRLEAGIAIGLVGAIIAGAAWAGAATGGRSAFFQFVLAAFGLHSIAHAAQSAIARGYTPGVVTALLVVAPWSWWAWRQLTQAGIAGPGGGSWVLAVVLFPPAAAGAHLISRLVCRGLRRSP